MSRRPWTKNPLKFDNSYFKHLLEDKWKARVWDGPLQYEDEATGKLMMLPTDVALKTDDGFRPFVELYARDEGKFREDFAAAFGKLLALGGAPAVQPGAAPEAEAGSEAASRTQEFLELAMHGSMHVAKKLVGAGGVDVHGTEPSSARTALHKAAFWGHVDFVSFLVAECKLNPNATDYSGDTALHDAARFGHDEVVSFLLANGACAHIRNARGQDARAVAVAYAKEQTAALLGGGAAGAAAAAAGPAGSQQVRAGRVSGATAPNVNAIKSDIRRAVINQKASECAPCVVRWHAGPLRAWAHSAAAMRPPS